MLDRLGMAGVCHKPQTGRQKIYFVSNTLSPHYLSNTKVDPTAQSGIIPPTDPERSEPLTPGCRQSLKAKHPPKQKGGQT
jgi:hypothetical protein